MNIFLASQASQVLKKICTFLPKPPQEYKVVFIPTASKIYTSAPWIEEDRNELLSLGFSVKDLNIESSSHAEVKTAIAESDVIFVGGGNTFYLLEHAKKSGFIEIAKQAVKDGAIYIGSSAGSVLASPDIRYVESFDDPSEASLRDTRGLGLVSFSVLPHAGNPEYGDLHAKVMEQYITQKYPLVPLKDTEYAVPQGDSWKIVGL